MENQELIKSGVEHPLAHRKGTYGDLVRFRSTGIYALRVGAVLVSVPQDWAAKLAISTWVPVPKK